MDFQSKTVLITGGTSGIGLCIAKSFAARGANVIAAGLGSDEVTEPGIRSEALEVTDADSVTHLLATVSRLDVLVNAAGIIRRDAEFELDRFAEVVDVNLTGVMRVTMAAKAKLMETRGCVVNFASMYSTFGAPRAPAYAASKAAVVQLTRSLAVAWASLGVRVNAVAPGWVATSLTQALRDDQLRSAQIVGRTPMARWATPEDIVGPVLFLASELAGFVTGVVLPVDGGYSVA